MDLSAISPGLLFASLMVAATPILLAAIGEMVVERAGVLNLGVEGMMITGAVTGFITSVWLAGSTCPLWLPVWACNVVTSPYMGFVGAALGGAGLAVLFGLLTQYLLSNQVATGLALTLFGLGLAALLGQGYVGVRAPSVDKLHLPFADIPHIGPALLQHDAIVYLSLLLCLATWAFLTKTRAGLILRAVGENHEAAHALGYNVIRIRLFAILFGGACAGLGGAYLSLIRVPQWTEGVTAGSGWIALAIVVFSSWRAGRLVIGAYLFGGIAILQLNLQAAGVQIPVEYLSMAPYVITIIVLVILSAGKSSAALAAPGSLGKPFHASR